MFATIRMAGDLIDGQDGLTAVHEAIRRNRPADRQVSIGDLTGQVRKMAVKALRDANAYFCRFSNGDTLVFIGRLPPGVSEEAAVAAVTREESRTTKATTA